MDTPTRRLAMLHSHIKEVNEDELTPTFPQLPRKERELLMKSSFQSLLMNLSLKDRQPGFLASRPGPHHPALQIDKPIFNGSIDTSETTRNEIVEHSNGSSRVCDYHDQENPAVHGINQSKHHNTPDNVSASSSQGLQDQVNSLLGLKQATNTSSPSTITIVKSGTEILMIDHLFGKHEKMAYFTLEKLNTTYESLKLSEDTVMFSGVDRETVETTLGEDDYDAVVLEYGKVANFQELIDSIRDFNRSIRIILHIPDVDKTNEEVGQWDLDVILLTTDIGGSLIVIPHNEQVGSMLQSPQYHINTKVESGVIQILSQPFEVDTKKVYNIYDYLRFKNGE